MNWREWVFDAMYRFGKAPWDSGTPRTQVVAWMASGTVRGRALDLGCGTGTNAVYLAQQGLTVVGVDFSSEAIALAREKARRANVAVDFHIGDVTRLDLLDLREPFDFVLDTGCLHGIAPAGRARYAEHLARLTRPGSVYMLHAFQPGRNFFLPTGLTAEQVQQIVAPHFALTRVEQDTVADNRPAAWYWFNRR